MRDHSLLGSATVSSGLPIPGQADPATDTKFTLLKGYSVCSHGELSTIQQGKLRESWEQRYE